MKPEQLKAIKARCEAATEGEWFAGEDYYGGASIRTVSTPATNITGENAIFENTGRGSGGMTDTDLDFIAHARTDLPACIKEIERLENNQSKLLQSCKDLMCCIWHDDCSDCRKNHECIPAKTNPARIALKLMHDIRERE